MFLTLLAIMVMSIVGLALASGAQSILRLTRIQRNGSAAFNLAESGAERALLWLSQQGAPPSTTSAFNPFNGAVSLGDGTYTVTLDGNDANPSLLLKQFTVRSVGTALGRTEVVEMFVQQSNFGRYAYFTDYEVSSLTNSAIWFKAGEVVDGPAHSNNTDGTVFHINYINSVASIFKADLTAVEDHITYSPGDPGTEADFLKVYSEGSRGYRLNVNRIELPETTDRQRNAAWGDSSGFPTSNGVYINADGSSPRGGIYIRGDAGVQFVAPGGSTQVIQITQGTNRFKVTVDRAANQTVLRRGNSDWNWSDSTSGLTVTTFSGLPNGVLYSTGHITSLKGTLADGLMSGSNLISRNAWTIATDLVNAKNVTITDHVQYATPADRTRPWDDPVNLRAAALGVVARNIELDTSAPTNLTVHGVMLAGGRNTTDGSFYNEAWNTDSPGTLTLHGGIIQKKRGPVGTFNSSTGQQSTGFAKNYSYDRRMAVNPPPFFPTTGLYERLSWSRTQAGFATQ
jgi:hypothetical protein